MKNGVIHWSERRTSPVNKNGIVVVEVPVSLSDDVLKAIDENTCWDIVKLRAEVALEKYIKTTGYYGEGVKIYVISLYYVGRGQANLTINMQFS